MKTVNEIVFNTAVIISVYLLFSNGLLQYRDTFAAKIGISIFIFLFILLTHIVVSTGAIKWKIDESFNKGSVFIIFSTLPSVIITLQVIIFLIWGFEIWSMTIIRPLVPDKVVRISYSAVGVWSFIWITARSMIKTTEESIQ